MSATKPDLPYFDLLFAHPEEAAARVFESSVHWGYWDDPSTATLDAAGFRAAMARLDDQVLDAARLSDGQTVLDAGCGFGGTLAAVQKRRSAMSLTGLNIDPRQLERARAAVPGARFVEGDACALPFPDASFDRVLAVECIFHFPSRARFLVEAARVLKPGGLLSLSDFVPEEPGARGGFLGRLVEAKIVEGYGAGGGGWEGGDYAAMAAKAGLEVVLDRDVTKNTLPTYPVLLDLLRARPPAARMVWPTRLLWWASRLGKVRYRVVAFRKP
ncbi:MAG: methyltransferase domain-containing protein [Elusimicrobiota bacterium]|nr:methyltransferase domain-containing protein [Elusimicrobiota bacterium]